MVYIGMFFIIGIFVVGFILLILYLVLVVSNNGRKRPNINNGQQSLNNGQQPLNNGQQQSNVKNTLNAGNNIPSHEVFHLGISNEVVASREKWDAYMHELSNQYGIIPNNTLKFGRIDTMTGIEFEDWCVNLLTDNGFTNVCKTPVSGDQGVDITAQKEDIKYAFQCKCYSSDLGNTPIQEVYAGKNVYNCQIGVVMTNRHFTEGATLLAEKTGVLLWDREKLKSFIKGNDFESLDENMIQVIGDAYFFKGKNYLQVATLFTDMGFQHIRLNPIYDLASEESDNGGYVEKVLINDSEDYSASDLIECNARIDILYHRFITDKEE